MFLKKRIQILVNGGIVTDIIPINFTEKELENLEISVLDFDNLKEEFTEEELEIVDEKISDGTFIQYVTRDKSGEILIVENEE